MKSLLLVSALILSPLVASAAPITYSVNETFSGFSAVGSITTDGLIGTLSSFDIGTFTLHLTEGTSSSTITTTNGVGIYGNDVTATSSGLFYNFNDMASSVFGFYGTSGAGVFCFGDGGACTSGNANAIGINLNGIASVAETGLQQIGTAATVTPEPSSITLLGTGVLGVIGLARRRLSRR